jgi:hypothetical protein
MKKSNNVSIFFLSFLPCSTFQIFAKGTPPPTGVQYMRVELTSHGQGINLQYGFPEASFKLSPTGINTKYR